jgi:hypothetical protein
MVEVRLGFAQPSPWLATTISVFVRIDVTTKYTIDTFALSK